MLQNNITVLISARVFVNSNTYKTTIVASKDYCVDLDKTMFNNHHITNKCSTRDFIKLGTKDDELRRWDDVGICSYIINWP